VEVYARVRRAVQVAANLLGHALKILERKLGPAGPHLTLPAFLPCRGLHRIARLPAHDAGMIRSTLSPDARLYSVRGENGPFTTKSEASVNQIASAKAELLERFTSEPSVSIRGRLAQVWGEYEFLRDGKFSHCGVDSVSLFKTAEGWRIATLMYTLETTGCKGH
jgi:hypothetical protein